MAFFRTVFAPPRHLILLLAALWLGLSLAEKRAQRFSIPTDKLSNLVYYSLLGYILGGRLLYLFSNLAAFAPSPFSIFSLNPDLFDPMAGLLVASIVGLIYGSRQKLSLWSTLDALTPLFAALSIGLALSHLAAGTAFGRPTELPWGIDLWNMRRHPTQMYELLAALVIFGITWFRITDSPQGSNFLLFAGLTAGARLFLEAFRGDSTLIFGNLRLAQVIAWVVLAGTMVAGELIQHREKVH